MISGAFGVVVGCNSENSTPDAAVVDVVIADATDSAVIDVQVADVPATDAPTDAGGADVAAADAGAPTGCAGFSTGCIPIASSMRVCADAGLAYAYVCANSQQPPEAGCAMGFGAGRNIVCCPHPFCVRDEGTDYQCGVDERHPSRPPHAFLCYGDAPADVRRCTDVSGAAVTLSGSPSQSNRVCCP